MPRIPAYKLGELPFTGKSPEHRNANTQSPVGIPAPASYWPVAFFAPAGGYIAMAFFGMLPLGSLLVGRVRHAQPAAATMRPPPNV